MAESVILNRYRMVESVILSRYRMAESVISQSVRTSEVISHEAKTYHFASANIFDISRLTHAISVLSHG